MQFFFKNTKFSRFSKFKQIEKMSPVQNFKTSNALQGTADLKVSSSSARINDNFSNYFLKTKLTTGHNIA